MARKLERSWLLVSDSPDETARCLLYQTGSVQAAREAITRNAGCLKRPKRNVPNEMLLLSARGFQRKHSCSDHAALSKVAQLSTKDIDAAATVLRRMRRALKGKTLAEWAQPYPEYAQLVPLQDFAEPREI
jgi:hypothetical protein